MCGEINKAPIITAAEFIFKPTDATIMANINILRFVPLKTMSFVMFSCITVKSSSSFSILKYKKMDVINYPFSLISHSKLN